MNKRSQLVILGLILVSGFSVRLYKIYNPIADWHSWRQADTAAVTRNYVKYGVNLLYPRYDDFSDVSGNGLFNPNGFRFVEFPIFNIIHYILYSVFGTLSLEVWGRLTSAFSSIVSGALLFAIVRRRTSPVTGLLASGFYLFLPYNIYFTRVILPDPLMVTLFLTALNFNDLKRKYLTLLFGSLAIAVKPIAVFFLLPIYLSNLWLGLLMLVPFGLWRFWSHRYPEGIPASLWLLNGNKIRFKPSFFQWIFSTRIASLILGKWGLWPFLHGLIDSSRYFFIWTAGAVIYLFVFAMGNVHHDYYQIPITPIISVYLAIGTVKIWRQNILNKLVLIICLVFLFGFSWYEIRGLYQINNWSIVHAGNAVDKQTPSDSVVVAPYQGDTAFLYQTNRPGFPYMVMPIKDMIDRFGADYYVSVNYDSQTKSIMDKYIVVDQTPEYVIVKLEEPIRP